MLMYRIYNAETLEKLINAVHHIHNTTSSPEKLFAGQHISLTFKTLYANVLGLQHYPINSLIYLRTIQDKYVSLYKELITQLHIYATAIRVLAKGYLPISLITPLKLKVILSEGKIAIRKTNLDYEIGNFGIDRERNLIIQFPAFTQPSTQQPLILYQIEMVPILITGQNKQAHSYTH